MKWRKTLSKLNYDYEIPICPYCGAEIKLRNSIEIYGRDYGYLWVCKNYPQCDSYVGCHKGTTIPLGTPANKELRNLRHTCHLVFDKAWKCGKISRIEAYKKLGKKMGIPEPHIGQFNKEQCEKLLDLLKNNLLFT